MSELVNDVQFEVQVHQRKLKTFNAVCQFLSKIGRYMNLEIEGNIVSFHALSDAKSAFATVTFANQNQAVQPFFEYVNSNAERFSCKIPLKAMCSMMKNMKNVMSITMRGQIAESQHELVFDIILSNHITRTYRFHYAEMESMNAVFDDRKPNLSMIRCEPKIFHQLIDHIHHANEIAIHATHDTFEIRSFRSNRDITTLLSGYTSTSHSSSNMSAVGDVIAKGNLATGISINIDEFDIYEYRGSRSRSDVSRSRDWSGVVSVNDLAFCLREFRGMLSICESEKLGSILFYFSSAGSPIKISAEDSDLSIELIMATLSPQVNTDSESQLEDDQLQQQVDQRQEVDQQQYDDQQPQDDNMEPRIMNPNVDDHDDGDTMGKMNRDDDEVGVAMKSQESSYNDANLLINIKQSPVRSNRDVVRPVIDFRHLASAMISSPPSQGSDRLHTENLPSSSARKRRIVDDEDV